MAKVAVIVPAAGAGKRYGGKQNKIFERVGARIVPMAADAWRADLVVKVKEPQPQECAMLRPGQVLSKSELTERLYDQDFDRDSNVSEVFVGRLRKKLDPDGELNPIETLRGRGYRWSLDRNGG